MSKHSTAGLENDAEGSIPHWSATGGLHRLHRGSCCELSTLNSYYSMSTLELLPSLPVYTNNYCVSLFLTLQTEKPTCPKNYDLTYYGGGCQCRCRSTNYCPTNYVWNSHKCDCVCVTTNYCSTNYYWDPSPCKCVCEKTNYCATNYRWDVNQCKCVCNSWGQCSAGYSWDHASCSCKYNGWGIEDHFLEEHNIH